MLHQSSSSWGVFLIHMKTKVTFSACLSSQASAEVSSTFWSANASSFCKINEKSKYLKKKKKGQKTRIDKVSNLRCLEITLNRLGVLKCWWLCIEFVVCMNKDFKWSRNQNQGTFSMFSFCYYRNLDIFWAAFCQTITVGWKRFGQSVRSSCR